MRALVGVAVAITVGSMAAASPSASAFETGVSGSEFTGDAATRDEWFDRAVDARAGIVRVNVRWSSVAGSEPVAPANPADPAYDFSAIDAAAVEADQRGLKLLLTIYNAPPFAEGPGRPGKAPPGSWKPDPGAFADFATAVATRYSGAFPGLPRVRYFQALNEPNLSTYLSPQWQGGEPFAAEHYRRMLNAFAKAVHGVRADNVVVTAGTAPFGDAPGGDRMRPLEFWREVLCLKQKGGKLKRKPCPEEPSFDILAHHPINTGGGGPTHSAIDPDNATTADFRQVRRLLRAAERRNTVGGGRHPLWATEIWWESNPPDKRYGQPLGRHADWNQLSLYLLWKQGADAVINLLIRDGRFDPGNPSRTIEAGLYFEDGSPKPALQAWRFPFVVDPKRSGKALAWTRSPADGELRIERRRRSGWKRVAAASVRAGEVETKRIRAVRGERFRARVGDEESLTWRVKR